MTLVIALVILVIVFMTFIIALVVYLRTKIAIISHITKFSMPKLVNIN